MAYPITLVEKRRAELKALMPELHFNIEGDFGWRLEATDPVSGTTVVVMRPYRFVGKKRSQSEINQPAAKVAAFFESERKRAKERGQ